jgi:hypothetical protein
MIAAFDLGIKNFAFAVKNKDSFILLINESLVQDSWTKTELAKLKKEDLLRLTQSLPEALPTGCREREVSIRCPSGEAEQVESLTKKEDKKIEKMEKKLKITKKDLITLILSKNTKTKPDLGLSLFNVMDKYKDTFNTCEIFLVERQMLVNRQALKLSHYLEAWLKINYPDKKVINYSASQKTKLLGAKNLKTKKDRKLWTVEYTLNLLQGETLEQFKQFRKQDDLADVVCMIESYLRKKK